jgi:hypothetical protein
MERHDTKTRAARYLMGAGVLAAAMVAMAATNAGAATTECYRVFGEDPLSVCGHVYDSTGSELPGVTVAITDDGGGNVAFPVESGTCESPLSCGYYTFFVPPGDYWVCLITDPAATDCSDTEKHPEAKQVTVTEEGGHTVDFTIDSGGQNEEPPSGTWGSGTGTPGYWKNHPEAWPVDQITIGDAAPRMRTYTKQEAIALLGKPVAGDKTYTMFASLVSAMLNVHGDPPMNNPDCIAATIANAHKWFSLYGPAGSGVKAKSDAWVGGLTNTLPGEPIHTKMDDYNNGLLCAPHRN